MISLRKLNILDQPAGRRLILLILPFSYSGTAADTPTNFGCSSFFLSWPASQILKRLWTRFTRTFYIYIYILD